jgi:glyoxylase-like metal-dependent hydrolase (beta-lactamase superfamily II)
MVMPMTRTTGDYAQRIHRIELPVPFPIQTTNAYLIEEEPITVVDPGIRTEPSFHALENSLGGLGYRIEDIDRILITHGHVDHYGQARKVARLSGAKTYIYRKEYERIRSTGELRNNLVSVLTQNGIPRESLNETIAYMHSVIQTLAEPLVEPCFLDEGDEVRFKTMVFRTLLCPGHSPGLLCFYWEEAGILISGDHLLDEISPNPIVDLSQRGPGPQSTSLKDYLNSIKRIQDLDVALVLPGHGAPIQDFKGALRKTLDHHKERLSVVLSVLSRGEKTAYEISKALFPNTKSFEVFLGVSEVLGHLRILLDEKRIHFTSRNGIDYYSTA